MDPNEPAESRAGEQSRRMPVLLQGVLDGIPTGVVVIGGDGRVIEANTKALSLLGSTREELLGRRIAEGCPGALPPDGSLAGLPESALKGGLQRLAGEVRRPHDAPVCSVDVVLRRTEGPDGEIVVATLRDVNELSQSQDRLLHAQRIESMATLVGGIAHEFSNILNNVLGFATLVKKYVHDRAKVLKYAQVIEQSVTRGDEVTQRLLAFARTENRAPEPVALDPLIEEIATALRNVCPATMRIIKSTDTPSVEILGVRKELFQAVMNLGLNARDAILANASTGGHGTIALMTAASVVTEDLSPILALPEGDRCVTLSVSDDGVGIREEIADRIFDPFFTTKAHGRGTGLGLSIVYTIVRSHHGTVLVDSTYGHGSAFRIVLPVYDRLRQMATGRSEAAARHTEMILLADDELPMLEFGRDILVDHGYRVLTARDGVEALELYRSHAKEIDLVILDLIMPRLDGGQTYLELKRLNPSVKAVFCSGFGLDDGVFSLLREGNLRGIRKPFKIPDFLAAIRETLDGVPPPEEPAHAFRSGG